MATIEDAIRAGVLEEYRLPDHELQEPKRRLLVAPEFFDDWLDAIPALRDPKNGVGGRTLHEHAEQMLCDLRCAAKPAAGDLRRMLPTRSGVWKLHPPGLRLYGWFHKPGEFVAITGATEKETKANKDLNNEKRDHVLRFAAQHGLTQTILKGDLLAIFPP